MSWKLFINQRLKRRRGGLRETDVTPAQLIDGGRPHPYFPRNFARSKTPRGRAAKPRVNPMKVRNSLKSLRSRHRNNRLVRRKGRVYVINKTQRRFKARQG